MSTTFLFTERYATLARPRRERLVAVGFGAALALLVIGAAGLFALQASFGDAVAAALRAL